MNEETSESGSPIHRYEARETGWVPPDMSDNAIEAISDHIERHIGPITSVFHEIISDLVHIDIHQIAPTEERPYWTLVTSGMSDLPMSAPKGREEWRHAELMLCLPKEWKMGQADFKDERNYWPIRWLKLLARFPHEYKTWLSWGHTMPNGDPSEPIHASVPFEGIVLLRPKTVSVDFWSLPIRENKTIQFFSVVPIYPGEMALKLKKGTEEIDRHFEKLKISEIIDPKRRDVSQNQWWKFW